MVFWKWQIGKFTALFYLRLAHNLIISDLYTCFQVAKLFQKIQEMVEEDNTLVFVLIGEKCVIVY